MPGPFLSVADVVLDPMIAGPFDVLRREEAVNSSGRSVQTSHLLPGKIGVVTSASPNDLLRLDDQQRMARCISVVSQFELRGPATGFQPDVVHWNGGDYVVAYVDVYPQYGPGFTQAVCASIRSMDPPARQAPQAVGEAQFDQPAEAGLSGAF